MNTDLDPGEIKSYASEKLSDPLQVREERARYRETVADYEKRSSADEILTLCPAHISIVTNRMIQRAKFGVRILSRRFGIGGNNSPYRSIEFASYFSAALRRGVVIDVLLADDDFVSMPTNDLIQLASDSLPLKYAQRASRAIASVPSPTETENTVPEAGLRLHVLSEDAVPIYKEMEYMDFMIADGLAYRVQKFAPNKERLVGQASFGSAGVVATLKRNFEVLKTQSTKLLALPELD